MEIKLNLKFHCIETEIKRLHNRAIFQYFKSDKNKNDIENRLELLQRAMEKFDFAMLRSRYAVLAGHNEENVILSEKKNQLVIYINGIKLDL